MIVVGSHEDDRNQHDSIVEAAKVAQQGDQRIDFPLVTPHDLRKLKLQGVWLLICYLKVRLAFDAQPGLFLWF